MHPTLGTKYRQEQRHLSNKQEDDTCNSPPYQHRRSARRFSFSFCSPYFFSVYHGPLNTVQDPLVPYFGKLPSQGFISCVTNIFNVFNGSVLYTGHFDRTYNMCSHVTPNLLQTQRKGIKQASMLTAVIKRMFFTKTPSHFSSLLELINAFNIFVEFVFESICTSWLVMILHLKQELSSAEQFCCSLKIPQSVGHKTHTRLFML